MNKSFDCVKMKHKGADKVHNKITKLSIDEELKFWQEKTDKLKKRKREITKRGKITA